MSVRTSGCRIAVYIQKIYAIILYIVVLLCNTKSINRIQNMYVGKDFKLGSTKKYIEIKIASYFFDVIK